MAEDEIINKVDQSGLLQFDLESLYRPGKRISFDLKDFLFEGLILKENDFRQQLKTHHWHQYQNAFVAVHCTADAVIPLWAWMLVAVSLQPVAQRMVFGSLQTLEETLFAEQINSLNPEDFRNQRIILKGCSPRVPVSAYMQFTARVKPLAKSLLFGEPCSTVPVFKAS